MKNKLRKLREDRDMTQEAVAIALHINKNTYQQYESNKRNISLENLVKIADYYHITCDEILLRALPQKYIEVSADEKKMVIGYQKLTRQHQRLIQVIIQELTPPESMPIQQTPGLRMAGRTAGNSSDPLPEPPEHPEELPDVPEDL